VSEPTASGAAAAPAGVRAGYSAVAGAYDRELRDELDAKPLDRALIGGFLELAGPGLIADVGCGPGHVTRYLAARHPAVVGLDLSDGMLAVARRHAPALPFAVADMRTLPVASGALAGAIALYSIIHLDPAGRAATARELARVLRPGGWLLVAFHIDSPEYGMGETSHLTSFLGVPVEMDGYYLDPAAVTADLTAAGLRIAARLEREPQPGGEHPSRRCYLLAQRAA
jgi:SAM-dependent methyltransferase